MARSGGLLHSMLLFVDHFTASRGVSRCLLMHMTISLHRRPYQCSHRMVGPVVILIRFNGTDY